MGRKRKNQEEEGAKAQAETAEAPVVHGEVTEDNPSGIESVSEEHAEKIGQLRGDGGPGAAGATVAGPVVHVATEGGTKPLPIPAAQQVEPAAEEAEEAEEAEKERTEE